MSSSFAIKSNLKKNQSAAVTSLFTGETESVREKLQRQQIVNDLNYGFEVANAEVDPEEEALGDIYDIDGFLEKKEEEKKKEEKKEQLQKKEKKPSKYIAILKQRADERKREMDIVYEKNKIKEREKEDALYAGKEKFITNAYKRKLEADRKWLDDVRKREEQNKHNKSAFLTRLLNSRADEPTDSKSENQVVSEPKENDGDKSGDEFDGFIMAPKEEEDEFDGFIMAPPEEQIKGNVESDNHSDHKRHHSRHGHHSYRRSESSRSRRNSRSRSYSRSRSHNRRNSNRSHSRNQSHSQSRSHSRNQSHSRSRSHSRNQSHSRNHSRKHHRHHHHSLVC